MPNFTYENDVYGKAPECVGCENLGKSVARLETIVREQQHTIAQTFKAIGVDDPDENDDPEVAELQDAVAVTIQFHKDEAGQMLERIAELEDEVEQLKREAWACNEPHERVDREMQQKGAGRMPVGNVTSLNDHLIDKALESLDRRGQSHSAIADLLRGCRGYDGRNSDQIEQLCARALEEVTE